MNQSSMSPAQPRWYVLQTKPQQEARVYDALRWQDFDCVLPLLAGTGNEPLFPRYIFVKLANTDVDASVVRRIPGVTGLLKLEEECAPVHESIVSACGNTAVARSGAFSVLSGVHEIACGFERTLELIQTVCWPRPSTSSPLLRAA